MKSASLLFLAVSSATAWAQPQESAIGPRFPPVAAALDAPIEWKAVRGEDGKPLPPQVSGDFKVELTAGAWCRLKQFYRDSRYSLPQSYFDFQGYAGFAIQPRITDRDGHDIASNWRSEVQSSIALGADNRAFGSWHGGNDGGLYFGGLTPYAKTGTVTIDFADPKRPPEANGSFASSFKWPDLPYPTTANTFLPVDKSFVTAHGSRVTLMGYGRYEPGLIGSTDNPKRTKAGLYFFVKEEKPKEVQDAGISLNEFKIGARDGKMGLIEKGDLQYLSGVGGDLHEGKGRSDGSSENKTYIFALPDTPRPLHLQLGYNESSVAWRQDQYLHSVSFPFDFRGYDMPVRDAQFAPVATARNADVEVALDGWQDRSDGEGKKNYLAWFWTRDLKLPDDPSLRWIIKGVSPQPGNPSKAKIGAQLNDDGAYQLGTQSASSSLRFRPDGSPVLGSGYRPTLIFSADAPQGQPQKWNMTVGFEQWRLKNHEWHWKAVPIPIAGRKVALNRVAISSGAGVKLSSIAVFDATHHFPAIERELVDIVDMSDFAQGMALSFEVNVADYAGSKAFEWSQLKEILQLRPGFGRVASVGVANDAISGQKSDAKVIRWTQIYPLDKLEANSFDFQLSWEADYPTGRTATFRFPNLPVPAKDSR